jgi:protein-tyrosine phosphatase
VLSFFSKRQRPALTYGTDLHSHLLPGLDDGVTTVDEAIAVIRKLQSLGFTRLITTPHVNDLFKNTPDSINVALGNLKPHLIEAGIDIPIEAAAEYYLDEWVMGALEREEPLLTFGSRILLFETNFLSEPYFLKDFLFKALSQGYRPLLAHPERYHYMTLEKAEDIRARGALFQINMLSLAGYYSKTIQKMAERLIEKGFVDFLGSDCHNIHHAQALEAAMSSRGFKKALDLDLLNKQL